ncbi:DUF4349 domain-containing protein [Paenibacillus xanthanilyticus]|uniref:DUF4349 domain-containing protein n=1 Tax=Paenibacillus xanthanilyticus TaxID=1783531 RepID=A0ABV8KCZ8_9BACL
MRQNKWFKVASYAGLFVMLLAFVAGCSSAENSDSGGSTNQKAANSLKYSEDSVASESAANSDGGADQAAATGAAPANAGSSAGEADGTDGQGGASSLGAIADPDGFNRKIVYRGSVSMEVEDYAAAQRSVSAAITASGGYILQFTDQQTSTELGGTYTIKVPANGFMSFLAGMEKLPHLAFEKSMQGTDVTEEYVDLESRLKARGVVEARLLAFMEKAESATALLQFSKELGEVQTEIERIKGRMRYLDQNVAYSTIELRIYQKSAVPIQALAEEKSFGDKISGAWSGSLSFLAEAAQVIVIALTALLPVAVVLAVIAVPAYMLYRSKRRRPKQQPREEGIPASAALPTDSAESAPAATKLDSDRLDD